MQSMELRKLGPTGLQVSLVGLGCNNFGRRCDADATRAVVERALDVGINFFDTADIYGRGQSEEFLGKALGSRRQTVVVATKFGGAMGPDPGSGGASRRHVMRAVEASLTRLGSDYIDLYQIHFPDANTPAQETLRALDDCVRQGKVRYIGCSNYSAWRLVEALWISRSLNLESFVSAQNEYSLLDRRIERDLLEPARSYGIGVLPFFPLASGLLTGKYRRGSEPPAGSRLAATSALADRLLTERNFEKVERLERFAEERGHTLLELAFGWLAAQPLVPSIIAGATSPAQIDANARATVWQLTPDELAAVDEIA
jgi:aryl-alcohol dehydrogenase-like predicted oxidoreductase